MTVPVGSGRITAEAANASTDVKPAVSASASVARVAIHHPTTGALLVTARVLTSEATCGTSFDFSASTDVVGLEVLGVPVNIPDGYFGVVVPGLGMLELNSVVITPNDPDVGEATSLVARALELRGSFGEIVIAESKAAC
jgi:hypothetical protein